MNDSNDPDPIGNWTRREGNGTAAAVTARRTKGKTGLRPEIQQKRYNIMMRKQEGFTLIELVAVIVILGALAVVALPRFISLQEEAEQAAVEGVAGGISSAFAVNYAASLAADSTDDYEDVLVDDSIGIGSGDFDINTIMQTDLSGYTVSSACSVTGEPGDSEDCTVQSDEDSNATATFTAIATSS